MSPDEFLDRIRAQMIGRPVSYRRLAGNSLLVYIDCEPGVEQDVLFWFEPTWHFRGPEGVLAGSRQAQEDDDAPDPMAGFHAAGRALDALLGRTVEAVAVEPATHSLVLDLIGGYQVRSFVSDPTDDLDWHIDERTTRLSLEGCAAGLELVQRSA